MRKFLQEVIYWFGGGINRHKTKKEIDFHLGAGLFMITLTMNFMFILFVIQLYTNISTFDYFDSLLPEVFHDKSGTLGMQKLRITLYCMPFVLLFSYIFYKIIFYKTNIKKAIKYYDNLPKKRRRKGAWLTGIYIALSVILGLIFAALGAEEQKTDRVHPKAEGQKIDTFYLDRLPDEANLLLPKKDTANKK